MMGGGFAHLLVGARNDHDDGQLGDGDGERWKLGAGLGGVGLGLAAGALGPHLHPRRSALGMSAVGLTLGLGAPLFASWAATGSERTPAETAVRTGTLWFAPSLAATAGLVASRWWDPTAADEMTVVLTSALGATAGLGLARTLSPLGERGWRDATGVYAGTAVGLGAGALFTHAHALTAPELGGMVSGAAWGAFLGRLAPTLALRDFRDDRATSGGTWLGLGVTGAAGATLAGLTHATGAEVAVPTVAAAFGTGLGAGAGLMVPGTSSRPVRLGIFAGALGAAAASVAAEPWLHLSSGLGPSAPSLGLTLGSLGAGYGLLLAGALDPSGVVSGTPDRQLSGGLLLGGTAGLGTGLVLSRFIWDPMIMGPDVGSTPIFNWLLYGYGVPAASFWVAGYLMRRDKDDGPLRLVESAALFFTGLLGFLENRHYMTGNAYVSTDTLAELALDVCFGLGFAILLEKIRGRTGSVVHNIGALIVTGLTLLAIVIGLGVAYNPAFSGEAIAGLVFNQILLGYGITAVLTAYLALITRNTRPRWHSALLAIVAVVLALGYLSLQVMRIYHGPILTEGPTTDAEQYTYSAVWLAFGVVLLAAGIYLRSLPLRVASAAVVLLTVFKVFFVDMSDLTGIYRALSFIGLGAVLMGIGWFYQRLLFPRKPPPEPEAAA